MKLLLNNKTKAQVVTLMAATGRIAPTAPIDPSYSLGGVNVHRCTPV